MKIANLPFVTVCEACELFFKRITIMAYVELVKDNRFLPHYRRADFEGRVCPLCGLRQIHNIPRFVVAIGEAES